MASFTWASSTLRSRWLWAAAALLTTILIFRSVATTEIVSKYTPDHPLFRIAKDDHPQENADVPEPVDNLEEVRNSTLGFQKVFAISLPSRTDQHDTLTLAGQLQDIDFDFIDGVNGTEMDPKVIPLSQKMREEEFHTGSMGAWRAHINALQKIVRERIQSALIIEGDVDWDIRFKDQLVQFAKASRILVQPAVGSDYSIDPSSPESRPNDVATEFALKDYDRVQPSPNSPYGDVRNWDVLWLGHCKTRFTEPKERVALGRVVISDDVTVPQSRWIDTMFGAKDLKTSYPDHTRIVHQTTDSICTFGYAITQKAARALLYECGIKLVDSSMDVMLRNMCAGDGRPKLRCLSVQPSYFYQHVSQGIISDIHGHTVEDTNERYTRNIRLSSRMNLQQMIFGWDNYTEQWRDDQPGGFE